jgi:hypothetical protein
MLRIADTAGLFMGHLGTRGAVRAVLDRMRLLCESASLLFDRKL